MKKILLSAFFVLGSFLSMPANADGVDDMKELTDMMCKTHSNKEACEKLMKSALTVSYSYGKISGACELWAENASIPASEKDNCNNSDKLDDYFGVSRSN
ncbi:hypothetical protein MIB43_004625 [Providencia rettgeri]|uniref:hypothetical protein n=1 Tax=Providencia rettgeri TaxID=587 RepID=UPI001F04495A|nr:hypothetical protein [Providencia rettgeri]